MATCLKIPWTEEPGRLESIGSPRIVHELVTEHEQNSIRKIMSSSMSLTKVKQIHFSFIFLILHLFF